jgi:hypothetical protein
VTVNCTLTQPSWPVLAASRGYSGSTRAIGLASLLSPAGALLSLGGVAVRRPSGLAPDGAARTCATERCADAVGEAACAATPRCAPAAAVCEGRGRGDGCGSRAWTTGLARAVFRARGSVTGRALPSAGGGRVLSLCDLSRLA